jgi:hypothetical protein
MLSIKQNNAILGRASTIVLIQLKNLSKLAIQMDYLMSSSNNMMGEKSYMAGLSAISNHHHLHHHLVPEVRLRVTCNSILHAYHLTFEPDLVANFYMATTALMLMTTPPISRVV